MYRAKPQQHTTIVEMGSTINDHGASLTLQELQHGANFLVSQPFLHFVNSIRVARCRGKYVLIVSGLEAE